MLSAGSSVSLMMYSSHVLIYSGDHHAALEYTAVHNSVVLVIYTLKSTTQQKKQ